VKVSISAQYYWCNVKFKHIGLNAVVFSRFVTDSVWGVWAYSLATLLKETLDLALDGVL
jgi:hypothetical protein